MGLNELHLNEDETGADETRRTLSCCPLPPPPPRAFIGGSTHLLHLKRVLGRLAEGLLALAGPLPHGAVEAGEERPRRVVAARDVAAQRARSVRQQVVSGQIGVLEHRLLAP